MITAIDKQAIEKDALANLVYRQIERVADDDACLYYNFPFFIGDVESDNIEARLFLVSPLFGIFFFDLDSHGQFDDNTSERVDNLYNEISSRMLKYPELRHHRNSLKYDVISVIVGNYEYKNDNGYIFCKSEDVASIINNYRRDCVINTEDFRLIIGCVEGTAKMITKKERKDVKPHTKAYVLNEIQNHIANFDQKQKTTAIIDIDLPQRIRGLAGSGKTIVLAYKAALFHLHHREQTILYTFFTKSLADTVKALINRVYKLYSNNVEPDWEKIHVLHGWGGSTTEGVYYNACKDNQIIPKTLQEARGHGMNSFAYICKELNKNDIEAKYDLILIDEGQDFPIDFYKLCYKLCRTKRICWAYDDFQNIFEVDIQDEHKTFGFDKNGKPCVDLGVNAELQDQVLEKCYRTPRYVLITAFALGLGIYYEKVLQRLDTVQLWDSLGFKVESGTCETGSNMVISRPEKNTPSYSNAQFKEDSIIYKKCNDITDECRLISGEITNCIFEEGLLPTDICVICLDMKNIDQYFLKIHHYLTINGVDVFDLLQAPYANTAFFREGCVTLSTVNKAKGNECGVVFLCGVDAVYNLPENIVMRDKLFTSMTRTKGWLYLTGCGVGMDKLLSEYNKLKQNDYKLIFIQPDKSVTKNIENVSKKREEIGKNLLSFLEKFQNTGLSQDEIMSFITQNLKK